MVLLCGRDQRDLAEGHPHVCIWGCVFTVWAGGSGGTGAAHTVQVWWSSCWRAPSIKSLGGAYCAETCFPKSMGWFLLLRAAGGPSVGFGSVPVCVSACVLQDKWASLAWVIVRLKTNCFSLSRTHTLTQQWSCLSVFQWHQILSGLYSRWGSCEHRRWKRNGRAMGKGQEDKVLLRSRDEEAAFSRWLHEITPTQYRWGCLRENKEESTHFTPRFPLPLELTLVSDRCQRRCQGMEMWPLDYTTPAPNWLSGPRSFPPTFRHRKTLGEGTVGNLASQDTACYATVYLVLHNTAVWK